MLDINDLPMSDIKYDIQCNDVFPLVLNIMVILYNINYLAEKIIIE